MRCFLFVLSLFVAGCAITVETRYDEFAGRTFTTATEMARIAVSKNGTAELRGTFYAMNCGETPCSNDTVYLVAISMGAAWSSVERVQLQFRADDEFIECFPRGLLGDASHQYFAGEMEFVLSLDQFEKIINAANVRGRLDTYEFEFTKKRREGFRVLLDALRTQPRC